MFLPAPLRGLVLLHAKKLRSGHIFEVTGKAVSETLTAADTEYVISVL
ncbi:MAG: hypothetical protein AVDCRST_MAG56-1894 [uncultured Cytophagales bacterium]|uniref:Uncharacterized protein n=1 Tax=uncultured Cytophagales bacterium TaxID=158755 RepID=A0A6J4IFH7_9SPHI|nr:MAG: hypothetical protein AVDCRST_MAG56-1894 [uncultured Cytophagales bacterium]